MGLRHQTESWEINVLVYPILSQRNFFHFQTDPRLIHGWHPLLQSRGALPTAGVEECTHMIDVRIASVGSTLLIKDCTGSTRCNTVKDVD